MKRTHVTAARLKHVKLHAVRIQDHLHVTGLSIHGALVVPTRAFWSGLARVSQQLEPDFGNEYAFFHRCLKRMGSQCLYFSVTVHDNKTALLTDVANQHSEDVDSLWATNRPIHDPTMSQSSRFESRALHAKSNEQVGRARCCDGSADSGPSDSESPQVVQPQSSGGKSWPLLNAAPADAINQKLWGWENFHRPPAGVPSALLNGPVGTLRPSRN